MKTKTLHRLFTAVLTGTLLFGGTQLVFANELEDIQNAGVIKVGVEGTYQPYTYHDEDGNLTGFDVDVAKAIAEKLGVEVDFTEADWDSLLAGIESGRIDTVINAVSVTDERKEKYDFAGPYFYIEQQVVIKKGNDEIKSWDDLKGKKVATNITSTTADIYKAAGAEVVAISTSDEAASLVLSGRADFCSFNANVFSSYLKEHPDAELEAAFSVQDSVDEYAVPVKTAVKSLCNVFVFIIILLVQFIKYCLFVVICCNEIIHAFPKAERFTTFSAECLDDAI